MGFDSLPDQLVSKSVTQGFSFNILCVGECHGLARGHPQTTPTRTFWEIGCCCPGHLLSCKGTSQAERRFWGQDEALIDVSARVKGRVGARA